MGAGAGGDVGGSHLVAAGAGRMRGGGEKWGVQEGGGGVGVNGRKRGVRMVVGVQEAVELSWGAAASGVAGGEAGDCSAVCGGAGTSA